MPGLLDIFNNMTPEQNQGLLAAAAQVLRNSGPSRQPYTLGMGLGDAVGAYQGSMEHQRTRKLAEQEAQQMAELRGYAIKDRKSDYEAQERARAQADRIAKRLSGLPATGAAPAAPEYMASAMPGGEGSPKIGGPGWLQAFQQQNGLQLRPQAGGAPVNQTDAYVQRLVSMAQVYAEEGNLEGANKLYEQAAKLRPEFDTTPRTANGPDGKPFQYIVGKRGEIQRLDGMLPREKMELANLNDRDVAYNPFDLKAGQVFQRGASPDAVLSAETQRRGQNMVDARTREQNAISNQSNQLKLQERLETRDMTKASQIASFDTMLGTLDRLKTHGGLPRSVGLYSKVPTMPGSDSANFLAELETFKSQAFIPMVAQLKGMGALSDAEGRKLTAAVGALDPNMSEGAFKASIDRVISDMSAARQRVSGVRDAAPTAPAAGGIPQGAINHLKMNPKLRDQFDAKYGAGAAASVLGR